MSRKEQKVELVSKLPLLQLSAWAGPGQAGPGQLGTFLPSLFSLDYWSLGWVTGTRIMMLLKDNCSSLHMLA